jgi:hypothetical protein
VKVLPGYIFDSRESTSGLIKSNFLTIIMATKSLSEDMHMDAVPPGLKSPPLIGEEGTAPTRAQKIPS